MRLLMMQCGKFEGNLTFLAAWHIVRHAHAHKLELKQQIAEREAARRRLQGRCCCQGSGTRRPPGQQHHPPGIRQHGGPGGVVGAEPHRAVDGTPVADLRAAKCR